MNAVDWMVIKFTILDFLNKMWISFYRDTESENYLQRNNDLNVLQLKEKIGSGNETFKSNLNPIPVEKFQNTLKCFEWKNNKFMQNYSNPK